MKSLYPLINYLFSPRKGIIATDDKPESMNKRLNEFNIKATLENRNKCRKIIVTTPQLEKYISAIIFHEETLKSPLSNGASFHQALHNRGIIVGVKADKGLVSFSRNSIEKKSKGLEDLDKRLTDYKKYHVGFCKWRSVFSISSTTPTIECIKENVKILTQYAKIALSHNILPILEPEVLMTGSHCINECQETTQKVLLLLFDNLRKENIDISKIILKTNMVLPGSECPTKSPPDVVARETIQCLTSSVPHDTGGVVFLSGGQSTIESILNLRAIMSIKPNLWPISFSFDRAFVYPILQSWQGNNNFIKRSQDELLDVVKQASQSLEGKK